MTDKEKRRQAVDTIARHMIVTCWSDGTMPEDPPGIEDDAMWEVTDRAGEITKSIAVSHEQYETAAAHLRDGQVAP